MTTLNGTDLYQMFQYGGTFIVNNRLYLNDINVFPVADGDTGNNLSNTLQTIIREADSNPSFITTLDSISNAALIGARGNSGVIFAQFVNGLRIHAVEKDEITFDEFKAMVSHSYDHTIASLSNPVEGTMITMLRNWRDSLCQTKDTSIPTIFTKAYEAAKLMLEETKHMLDALKGKDVVDSGALGFVLFFKGIASYFNKESVELITEENVVIEDAHNFETEINYRYCTEGLVQYKDIDEDQLKSDLNAFGDSIIVARGLNKFRVHIHTNHPDQLFKSLENYGKIEVQKVDDMLLEMNMKNSDNKRVLVTDSIADIDPSIVLDNNIVVIPLNITMDQTPYLDKLSISNQILFDKLDDLKEYPSTATPSIKYVNDLFSKLLLRYDEIIVLTVSEGLSATYNTIKEQANKLPDKKIHVVDTRNNSVAQGLLVKQAAELLQNNASTSDIIEAINKDKHNAEILVCLETFKYATMSGRLPKAVGKIGMTFGIRPIMTLKDGKGSAFGFGLSQKQITKKIIKYVEKQLETNTIKDYALVHCLNEDLAQVYKETFTKIIGKEPSYISEVSTATAIHSGVGTVAIGYIKDAK
jgi:DegV family protein with EDD domain